MEGVGEGGREKGVYGASGRIGREGEDKQGGGVRCEPMQRRSKERENEEEEQ